MTSFVLLLVSLILSAAGSSAIENAPARLPTRPVAYVNGTPIMSDRLDLAVNTLLPQETFHRGVSPDKITELRRKALERLVDEELVYQEAERRGIPVSVAEVDAALADLGARYESPRSFTAARLRAGITARRLRRDLRRAVMIRKVQQDAVGSRCGVDRMETASFFKANRARFVVPEELHIQAITIGVDPSSRPSEWKAAQARAEQVRRRLIEGAPFDVMARQYSTDPSRQSGGDMGFFHRGSLADEFEAATRGLQIGEVSAVVRTIYGYHLVRVTEVRPSRQKTFEEVGAELQKTLTAKRCTEMSEAWLGELRAGAEVVTPGNEHEVPGRGPLTRRRAP